MVVALNPRERRILSIGLVVVVVCLGLVYVPQGIRAWRQIRRSITDMEDALIVASGGGPKQRGLALIVPVVEMPSEDPQQMLLFRDTMNEQLQKAGVETGPVQVSRLTRPDRNGYRHLTLSYKGECGFDKFLDLLACLKENPYLAGIERLKIRFDPQQEPRQRQTMEVELAVSTFVRTKK